ncbi:MAG: hypothetical protein N2312_01190 [Dictyoglomaceae bacterium]|nr:hypothetical protein [Dictyoglomaceae bacterium]
MDFKTEIESIYPLLNKEKEEEIKRCKICNEPSALETCAVCNIKLKPKITI